MWLDVDDRLNEMSFVRQVSVDRIVVMTDEKLTIGCCFGYSSKQSNVLFKGLYRVDQLELVRQTRLDFPLRYEERASK